MLNGDVLCIFTVGWSYLMKATHFEWNNSKEKDSRSDSKGLLFVIECIVVIKSIHEDI